MCAAATIIEAIRQRAHEHNPNNAGIAEDYDAMHIRRGDFQGQYMKTGISAHEIYELSKDQMAKGSTLYVTTDEQDKTSFSPIAEHYNVLYLEKKLHLIPNLTPIITACWNNLYVARVESSLEPGFLPCRGYINRIRGEISDFLLHIQTISGHNTVKHFLNLVFLLPFLGKAIMQTG
jgi:hypothetical protein